MNEGIFIAAIGPVPGSNWVSIVSEAATAARLKPVSERQRIRLPGDRRSARGFDFSDDVVLTRLWLSSTRWAVAALGQRSYYEFGSPERDTRPERQIVGSTRPPGRSGEETAALHRSVLEQLAEQIGGGCDAVSVERVPLRPPELRIAEESIPVGTRLNDGYKAHGFDTVPDGWMISVCPVDGVPFTFADSVVQRIGRAAAQRRVSPQVQVVSAADVANALADIAGAESIAVERVVLFVLPRRDRDPSRETLLLFAAMDAAGVRYRRSYSTDALDFSIPDQLPSLLIAAGGRPHRVSAAVGPDDLWSVGIDLSHRRESEISKLAVTLIDPVGSVAGVWVGRQRRDETALPSTLAPLLRAASAHLRLQGSGDAPLLVLRDGRLFEREVPRVVFRELGSEVTLVEYRKRGNPTAYNTDDGPLLLPAPHAVRIPDATTMFLAPAPPRTVRDMPAVAKVTWEPSWNRLDLSYTELASIIAGQTLGPGLGLHQRTLPAPIYWADGVAGATDSDLRFRGNAPVVM